MDKVEGVKKSRTRFYEVRFFIKILKQVQDDGSTFY